MVTKRDIATTVILMIVTCGIYALYWYWTTIHELDAAGNSSNMSPIVQFVLLFCCGIGAILFPLNADANINAIRQQKGLPTVDNKILWLILSICIPIVSVILIQLAMNELAEC